jgi:hypothetical protein
MSKGKEITVLCKDNATISEILRRSMIMIPNKSCFEIILNENGRL